MLPKTQTDISIIDRVLLAGDLSKLSPEERTSYYMRTCESLGLNPMTRPFEYITLNSKLTLYARKDATDQLRSLHDISIGKPDIQWHDDLIIVTVCAHNGKGREDADVGVVQKDEMRSNVGNAIMKAITKAKRRVTLSICGLGMLDETEVETIPDAKQWGEKPTNGKAPQPAPQTAPQLPESSIPPLFTLDEIVEQAKAMLATPPTTFGKSQFDALKRTWRDVMGMARESGVESAMIPGDKAERPSAYYQAIVTTGEALLAYYEAQKQADTLPA